MTDLLARIERGEPVEAQEIFDFAVGKVIEQGAPARTEFGCVYRDGHGRKCAFGHLIPDSLYKYSFEDVTAGGILNKYRRHPQYSPALAASLERHSSLITDTQEAHDDASRIERDGGSNFVNNFRHRAEAIARSYGLTFNF